MPQPLRWIVTSLAAAALAVPLPAACDDERDEAARLEAELLSGAAVGGDFALRDPRGRTRHLADFRGRVVLVYFGYTFCPDVCPTDLLQIARALRALGPDGREVAPLFITLDPARDTPVVLGRYVRSFHPGIVALRGSEAETRRVAAAFRVRYERVRPRGSATYVVNHTAFAFVLDRQGRYVGYVPPGTPGGRIAEVLREALAESR